ncbi:MAG: hypothetical protein IIC60_14220, partial [Proteobacteria bacterium]|nr:hypothetical protein [Pseudomonadota bacterium]
MYSLQLKTITLFLLQAFFLQQIAFAAPAGPLPLFGASQTLKANFSFPPSVATIEETYKAPHSKKTLILIQDAHTNASGQINVSKAL